MFTSGAKSSSGPAKYHLVPSEGLERIAHRFALGAERYGPGNWELGLDDDTWVQDRIDHAFLHLQKVKDAFVYGQRSFDDDLAALGWFVFVMCKRDALPKREEK